MPGWFPWVLLTIIIVLLVVAIVQVFRGTAPAANQTDHIPARLGVVLLGAVVVLCVAGLMFVGSNPPQVAKGTSVESVQQPKTQEAGNTKAESTTTETTTSSSAANAANLGLSGQIVGVFGTIAAAAVGGIAGLLAQARH